MIIRGGHNIDPMAIEEVFFQHPAVALAAVVGQPDAYAGELPVAYVQAKPGVAIDVDELLDFVRQRTPERAAVPVKLYVIDAVPLTGVGKVFKPTLRLDAAKRMVAALLADLMPAEATLDVAVQAHAVHGNLITVRVSGVAAAQRSALEHRLHERMNPLVMRHEVIWA
jgi:fatty-acyl-CoA synthase